MRNTNKIIDIRGGLPALKSWPIRLEVFVFMPLAMAQSTGHALLEIGGLTGHHPSGKWTALG